MITGIIMNDYRNDHRTTKRSSAPIQKEWPALEEMMGWWLCEEVFDGGGIFGEGEGEGGSFGGVLEFVVVLMEMEEEEDEGRELERLEWLLLWWR